MRSAMELNTESRAGDREGMIDRSMTRRIGFAVWMRGKRENRAQLCSDARLHRLVILKSITGFVHNRQGCGDRCVEFLRNYRFGPKKLSEYLHGSADDRAYWTREAQLKLRGGGFCSLLAIITPRWAPVHPWVLNSGLRLA